MAALGDIRLGCSALSVNGLTGVRNGFGPRAARVAHPSAAIFEKEFCQQPRCVVCGFGSAVLPLALQRESQRASVGSAPKEAEA